MIASCEHASCLCVYVCVCQCQCHVRNVHCCARVFLANICVGLCILVHAGCRNKQVRASKATRSFQQVGCAPFLLSTI